MHAKIKPRRTSPKAGGAGPVPYALFTISRRMKQLRAVFHGTVQGVGFRYTAERMARCFPVTGYVRNLPDGTVELAAEGEEEVLMDFVRAIYESPLAGYICDMETKWSEAEGQWKGFGIQF